jgi:hypothetical protein
VFRRLVSCPNKLSILIPHKHDPENDKALAIALACIATNTVNDYELLVDTTTPGDPYVVVNSLARRALGDYLFLSNSDIFVSPGWDVPMLAEAHPHTLLNATLVEPGAIGVHHGNIHHDFGMTPETFRRAEFEAWAATNPGIPDNEGFYFYALIHRETFLQRGCFDTTRGNFPTPLDIFFWEDWRKDGLTIQRGRGLVYHLQNYSNPTEQQKTVRQARSIPVAPANNVTINPLLFGRHR